MRFSRLPAGARRSRTVFPPPRGSRTYFTGARQALGRTAFALAAVVGLASAPPTANGAEEAAVAETTRWTMLHVQGQIGQADCHLITLPDGRHVLVDAGSGSDRPGAALAQLQRFGVRRLSLVILSHFHWDHYGQLLPILDSGITIDRLVVNVPVRRVADREIPWGCDYDNVLQTLAALQQRGIPFSIPRAGERLIETTAPSGATVGIEVLCAYDGVNTPFGETDVNDTSIVFRLVHGSTRVMFTGDMNHTLGVYLASSGADIRADILKAPHHGTEGCAPNEFYERVGASALLVPSPTGLWLSQRSSRTRTFYAQRAIPAFVNGLHGNVTVTLHDGGYRVDPEIGDGHLAVDLRPRIVIPPMSVTVPTGARVTLAATVTGSPAPSVQWTKDGALLPGANQPALQIAAAESGDCGTYTAIVANPHGTVQSPPAIVRLVDEPLAARRAALINLSARGWAASDDAQLIAGFVIQGQGHKTLLIRAVGPSLAPFGVQQPMPNPQLKLVRVDGSPIRSNDNWISEGATTISDAGKRVGAFDLPAGSTDAAMIVSLPPGAYTALACDSGGGSGIVLVELYDLEPSSAARLINLSGRAAVAPGDAALIGGFAVEGTGDVRLLCRAVGPSLARFGLGNFLPSPRLALHAPDIDSTSSWTTGAPEALTVSQASSAVGAFPLLQGSLEPYALISVSPGPRTMVITSSADVSGIALAEIYLVP